MTRKNFTMENMALPEKKRIKRKKATPEEMERVNKRNKEKRCRQRMLTYFREGDLFATLTYKVEERPPDMASAKKDFSKFIRKNPDRVQKERY